MCWTYPEDGLCAEEFQEGMQKEEVGGWKASWRRHLTNVDPGDTSPLSKLSYIMLEKSGIMLFGVTPENGLILFSQLC